MHILKKEQAALILDNQNLGFGSVVEKWIREKASSTRLFFIFCQNKIYLAKNEDKPCSTCLLKTRLSKKRWIHCWLSRNILKQQIGIQFRVKIKVVHQDTVKKTGSKVGRATILTYTRPKMEKQHSINIS